MGFQTNISILNDRFDWIENNPETFVKAIKYGMNRGTDSFVRNAMAAKYDRTEHWTDEEREAERNYVTVHQAAHADVPQVTYTHMNSSYDVYDMTRGFELDAPQLTSAIDLYTCIAEEIARDLRRQAKALTTAARECKERRNNASA